MRNVKSRAAAILVGVIAVLMIAVGVSFLTNAADTRAQTRALSVQGQQATVADARIRVFQGSDGERRVYEVEVTFFDSNGVPVTERLRTTPTIYVAISGPDGWEDEFTGKADIVGAPVRFLAGTPPTVELESELAAQANSPSGFFDVIGIALCAVGGVVLSIVLISALRPRRGGE